MQYGYDSTGNMTAMVNGLSALMENVNTGTVPEGAARTRYEYDFLNNMTKMIAPDGTEKTYEYDMFGNVTEEGFPDGSISYTYSAMNELLSMTGTKRKCFFSNLVELQQIFCVDYQEFFEGISVQRASKEK